MVAVWAIFNVPRDFLLAAGVLRNQDLLVLHLLLEGFSIVACVLIASTATLVRDQERLSSATLLAFGFSLIAGLDILHAVSLEGMPGFFFEASTSKAIFFWISARTVEVATILLFGLNFRVIKSPAIGIASAILVGALAGLISMTTLQVYRPLLIVLAATVSLWGFHGLVDGMAWYWTLLVLAVLFSLAYALFAWLARIRSFIFALAVVTIAVVLVRMTYLL